MIAISECEECGAYGLTGKVGCTDPPFKLLCARCSSKYTGASELVILVDMIDRWRHGWVCNCGYPNQIAVLPTDKKVLKCEKCGRKYWVRGTHVDGTPMLAQTSGPTLETAQE